MENNSSQIDFRKLPFKQRQKFAASILSKYGDRVPVIVESEEKLRRTKFLVPVERSFLSFIQDFKRNHLPNPMTPDQTIFFFCRSSDGTWRAPTITINFGELYSYYQEKDGLLYLRLQLESSFG